jgi:hypothetical protein
VAKKQGKIEVKTESWGLYAKWSNRCRELPKFLKFTAEIPARFEAEFGYILSVKNGKGKSVDYTVIHPPFTDQSGKVEPPFTGSIPIKPGKFEVYLGDTLWEPIEDKVGIWRVIAKIDGVVVEDKSFEIIDNPELHRELIDLHKNDHI